jgi:hypothetical protein
MQDNEPVQKSLIALVASDPPKLATIDEFTIDESNAVQQAKPSKVAKQPAPTHTSSTKIPQLTGGIVSLFKKWGVRVISRKKPGKKAGLSQQFVF